MPPSLTNDFKTEFAMLLVIMKVNFGASGALNYCQTLYEWTLAALVTEGKININVNARGEVFLVDAAGRDGKNTAAILNAAKKQYLEALDTVKIRAVPGQKEWAQEKLLRHCFNVAELVMPVALSEGILDLKDATKNVMAGMSTLNIGKEE